MFIFPFMRNDKTLLRWLHFLCCRHHCRSIWFMQCAHGEIDSHLIMKSPERCTELECYASGARHRMYVEWLFIYARERWRIVLAVLLNGCRLWAKYTYACHRHCVSVCANVFDHVFKCNYKCIRRWMCSCHCMEKFTNEFPLNWSARRCQTTVTN